MIKLVFQEIIYGSSEYKTELDLRYEILRKPLGLVFTDVELEKDKLDVHFGLFDGNQLIACAILSKLTEGTVKMRQVAVRANEQNKGYGRVLIDNFEEYCRKNKFLKIELNSRLTAVEFYQRLGYRKVGSEFHEVRIPHLKMVKELS